MLTTDNNTVRASAACHRLPLLTLPGRIRVIWRLQWAETRGIIALPYWLELGKETGFHGSSVYKSCPDYKGNQLWIFIGRTDAEAPTFGYLMQRANSLEKTPAAGKVWGQEEKRATEDEMVGWHDWLNGHRLKQTQGGSEDRETRCAAVHGVARSQTT